MKVLNVLISFTFIKIIHGQHNYPPFPGDDNRNEEYFRESPQNGPISYHPFRRPQNIPQRFGINDQRFNSFPPGHPNLPNKVYAVQIAGLQSTPQDFFGPSPSNLDHQLSNHQPIGFTYFESFGTFSNGPFGPFSPPYGPIGVNFPPHTPQYFHNSPYVPNGFNQHQVNRPGTLPLPQLPPFEASGIRPNFKPVKTTLKPILLTSTLGCGKVRVITSLSLGSTNSYRGQWPWYAQIFKLKGHQFSGGASIISKKFLLTAAHLFEDKDTNPMPMQPNEFYALLGVSEIGNKDEYKSNKKDFEDIVIHGDWIATSNSPYDADIALIKLEDEIIFTNLIQPICLPDPNDYLKHENIFGITGTVVGHGITRDYSLEPSMKTKHVQVTTVSDSTCLYSSWELVKLGSKRMFCAGEKGRNPCKGDSGGGLYISASNKWTILGIVSTHGPGQCGEQKFAMYTKVPDFVDWIEGYINR